MTIFRRYVKSYTTPKTGSTGDRMRPVFEPEKVHTVLVNKQDGKSFMLNKPKSGVK